MFRTSKPPLGTAFLAVLIYLSCFASVYGFGIDVQEADNTGWALHIDNDLLAAKDRDQDYTGGMALTLSGSRAVSFPVSIDRLRAGTNSLIGVDRHISTNSNQTLHALEFGFALFTPEDISTRLPIENQHPYASLFFISNTQTAVVDAHGLLIRTGFTLGLLGLPVAGDIQETIHRSIGSAIPSGWNNQIASGGELTARYGLGAQKSLLRLRAESTTEQSLGLDLNATVEFNLGFTTDIAVGVNSRWGLLNKPWWTFNPHQAEYVNLGSPAGSGNGGNRPLEIYAHMGAAVKYRSYNALLQGQFRDSRVSFDRSELEHVITETWGGIAVDLLNGTQIGFLLRSRSPEIITGESGNAVWGSLTLSFST